MNTKREKAKVWFGLIGESSSSFFVKWILVSGDFQLTFVAFVLSRNSGCPAFYARVRKIRLEVTFV